LQRLYFFIAMHVFYQPDLSSNEILLNEEESKHCIRVLRMKKDDEVHLADGKGTHALAKIVDDNPKKCLLAIQIRNLTSAIRNYRLHIIVAPTKNFDRIEWFIEKAVEAGIDEITFIECENSERAKVNMERCEKIAVSAMKQSKQWWLPKINSLVKLNELLTKNTIEGAKYMAWCETDKTALLNHMIINAPNYYITAMVGPEGDFTKTEVEQAKQAGFEPVSLGESILRTETAALYTCMTVKALLS
jgi:16S rRNA (uracil1498-N3)-methyltransferase